MVISKIYGGLGNQLFQYCLGRQLASNNNCELKLDLSYFEMENSWPYQLDYYEVDYQGIILKKELDTIQAKNQWWHKLLPTEQRIIAKDKNKVFQPNILKYKAPCIVDGYWQSEKYFIDIEMEIRNELVLKPEYLSEDYQKLLGIINASSYVSLHVRRGDYIKVGAPLASIDYYEAAINHINNNLENAQFVVFSDDIEWAKENLNFDAPVIWMEQNLEIKDFESLQLMSKCDHHIIGNSTYSWWGAWLNQNQDKVVIYPKVARTHLNRDIMPEKWIEI